MKDYRINFMIPALPLGPAIKPAEEKKRDLIAEFNSGDHKINGAARQAAGIGADGPVTPGDAMSPEAAPPSAAPVFKVGDRVRVVGDNAHWNGREGVVCGFNGRFIKANFPGTAWASGDGAGFPAENYELAPPEASSGSGWIEWKGEPTKNCPVSLDTIIEVRWSDGDFGTFAARYVCGWGTTIVAYRIVSQP